MFPSRIVGGYYGRQLHTSVSFIYLKGRSGNGATLGTLTDQIDRLKAAASITLTSLLDSHTPSGSLDRSTNTNSAATLSLSLLAISLTKPTPTSQQPETHNAPETRLFSSPKDSITSICTSISTYKSHKKAEPLRSNSDSLWKIPMILSLTSQGECFLTASIGQV